MSEAAHTFGLFRLAEAFAGIRKSCAEWKYRAMKAEAELEDLRMTLHQFAACTGPAKEVARTQLRAEAVDYHTRLSNGTATSV